MLTKKECKQALDHLEKCYWDQVNSYSAMNGVRKDLDILNELINEHFSNPPLEWEEIQELKKGDIIWDNLNKKNLKICFVEVSRWGEKIIDGWLEGDDMSSVLIFEPNRFFGKEV